MSSPTISRASNPDLTWRTELNRYVNMRLLSRMEQWQAGTITVEAMLPSEREDIQLLVVEFHNSRVAQKVQLPTSTSQPLTRSK